MANSRGHKHKRFVLPAARAGLDAEPGNVAGPWRLSHPKGEAHVLIVRRPPSPRADRRRAIFANVTPAGCLRQRSAPPALVGQCPGELACWRGGHEETATKSVSHVMMRD